MNKLLTILSAVLFSGFAAAQTYNSPESIEFDYANNRWLIANNSGNNILQRSSATGALTLFATCSGGPHGIEIVNDTLYVCAGANLKLFNLNTAALITTIAMPATFLNGITNDGTYLYATDFTAKKIFRINIATRMFSIFVTGLTKSPNGIIYDQPNNRCVFVNWGSAAPIMAMDITTGATSTVTATSLTNCDGITKDGAGNYYVSSWGSNIISRFNNTFTGGPTTVVTGLSSPADIFYNTLTDTLGNPNSGALNNTTYHYFGSATTISETAKNIFGFHVDPNPVAKTAALNYELPVEGMVKIELFDVKGQKVQPLIEEKQSKGAHTMSFDRSVLAAGNYFFRITANNAVETKKIVITK